MRVSCVGWKHIDKNHKLINRDISAIQPSSKGARYRDEVYIDLDGADVIVSSGVDGLQIKGNFEVNVRLSKKEIINLARIALAKEPFGDVVTALSGKK